MATPDDENVLSWLRGGDAEAERGFVPMEAVDETEDINMEPMVITVSRERREALLRRAGWIEVDIQLLVRDFNNEALRGYMFFLQFTGPRAESNTQALRVDTGTATFSSFWIKPNGILRVLAVPIAGTIAQGGPVLEGTVTVPGQIAARYVAFNVTQEHDIVQVTAANQQQVTEQMQASGNVKFSILKFAEVGGGISRTTGQAQTRTDQYVYTVRVGRPSLVIAPAQR
jgi:hypothetical protein